MSILVPKSASAIPEPVSISGSATSQIYSLATIIVIALALSGIVFVGSSVVDRTNISDADRLWRNYQDVSS